MNQPTAVCALADLPDPGCRSFTLGDGELPLRCFVVRRGGEVHGYVNRCPHAGHPLNWRPDRFFSLDGAHLQCNSHGALFDIATGECVAGPCTGRALTRIRLRIENDAVWVAEDVAAAVRAWA
jgi:nitrite reductase/ring-hydroxylating ferredoxin subunit